MSILEPAKNGSGQPTINEPCDGSGQAKPASRSSRPGSSCSMHGHLQVPPAGGFRRPSTISRLTSEVMSEDQAEAIRYYGRLSAAVLGLTKSFSTSDLTCLEQLTSSIRRSVSEPAKLTAAGQFWSSLQTDVIGGINRRLDITSRSCSTWVAVGDVMSCVSSTSQLPSPQAPDNISGLSGVDFVLSMNKKIRQAYIKRRLLTTYRAFERMSRSQLNLVMSPTADSTTVDGVTGEAGQGEDPVTSGSDSKLGDTVLTMARSASSCRLREVWEKLHKEISTLTIRDIELQKGKPLSKYERNMMIFNWLQDIDAQETLTAIAN